MRIGIGYDVHAFCAGRKLVLGGIEIKHSMGLIGHSDADVLIHAINDAILGACGLGDIGIHFPDTDLKYKDISSVVLLREVIGLMNEKGYEIVNCDCIIILQRPKIAGYMDMMKDKLSEAMKIKKEDLNIKATTTENMGFCGREEGASAQCVVLIKKKEHHE